MKISNFPQAFVLTMGTTLAAMTAQASPLTLDTGSAVQTGSTSLFFSLVGGLIGSGPGSATIFADLNADGSLATSGGFFGTQFGGDFISGEITQVGFNIVADTGGGDILQFVVDLPGAPFARGGLVTFTGEFGTNNSAPFGAFFFDGAADYTLAPIVVSSTPIPLPASLPVLASGLVGLVAIVRSRREKTRR